MYREMQLPSGQEKSLRWDALWKKCFRVTVNYTDSTISDRGISDPGVNAEGTTR